MPHFDNASFYGPVLNLDGKPVKEGDKENTVELNVKRAIRLALTLQIPPQQGQLPDGEKNQRCYELAMKVMNIPPAGKTEIISKDVVLIQEKLAYLGIEISGYLNYFLEQKTWTAPIQSEEDNKPEAHG